MFLRLETIAEKKLVGQSLTTSFSNDRTGELWRSFMPHKGAIQNMVNSDLISLQIMPPGFYDAFNPHTEFTKWALAEVHDHESVPEGMEPFILPEGEYAVFLHKGPPSEGPTTFGYIFRTWFPSSGYVYDNRPQFEILGAKYKNNHPDSEEEIWIPIKQR